MCDRLPAMKLAPPMGIRLDSDLEARLKKVCSDTGLSAGQVIRLALEGYLDHIDEAGAVVLTTHSRGDVELRKMRVAEGAGGYNPKGK